ncbi:lysoplasmalogenase [Jejuia spongiicola]|uniref:Lysoplasmalogenase n=1 Tax=Jejuia spongiicola TaxID=2942207 RepID=A0ABT0QEE0_9FLAO|nr:lysoplasmalogenase [Jejuia spongiicola]MCL6294340.1 lysoplasmalogenase [Jejuia spongiicola]
MLSKTEKTFSLIFLIIVIAELVCDNIETLTTFHYLTKPLILISLIFFFWNYGKHLDNKTRLFTFLALILSLFGDVLLIFADASTTFFIGGLVSFLLAHIMYVFTFLKKKNNLNNTVLLTIILLVYAAGLFYFLKDGLGDLLVPVIIYMIVILSMVITAFLRKGSVPKSSYFFVFLGALFFITSDSLLALNKFYEPLPFSGISIMLTYSIAQLFIVLGIKKQQ